MDVDFACSTSASNDENCMLALTAADYGRGAIIALSRTFLWASLPSRNNSALSPTL